MSKLYFLIAVICLMQQPLVSSLSVPSRSTPGNLATDAGSAVISPGAEIHKLHLQFRSCETQWLREYASMTKSNLFSMPRNDSGIGNIEGNDGIARRSSCMKILKLRHALGRSLVYRLYKQVVSGGRMMGTSILRHTNIMKRLWCGFILAFTLWALPIHKVPSAHAIAKHDDAVTVLARSVASSTQDATIESTSRSIVGGNNGHDMVVKKRKERNPVVVVATVAGSGAIAFTTTKNIKERLKSHSADKPKLEMSNPSISSTTAVPPSGSARDGSNTKNDSAEEDESIRSEGAVAGKDNASSQPKESDSDDSDGAIMVGIENLAEAVEEQVTKDVNVVLDDEKSIVISQANDLTDDEDSTTEFEESADTGVSSSILGMFKLASSVDRQEKRILASPSMDEILSPQPSTVSVSSVDGTEHSADDSSGASTEEGGSLSDVNDSNSEGLRSALPLKEERYARARMQPKPPTEEETLAAKYAAIPSVEERAYRILVDLGMVEQHNPNQ